MNILALSPVLPHAPIDGGRLRIFHLLRELSKSHRISLVTFCKPSEDIGYEGLGQLGNTVTKTYFVRHTQADKVKGVALSYLGNTPANISAYHSLRMEKLVRRLSGEQRFDAVVAFRLSMAPYGLMVKAPVRLLDFTDSMTLFYRRRAGAEKNLFKKWLYRREEKRLLPAEAAYCDQYDATFVNGSDDRECLAAALPWRPPQVLVNGVDREYLAPRRRKAGRSNRNIVFVGALSYPPNIDALEWFCREIFPGLKKRDPAVHLTIVGSGASSRLRKRCRDSSIVFAGHVDDFRSIVREAAVSVCPVRYGAGRQNKILEAFALGTPVVATSLCARLAEAQHDRQLLTADTASDFSACTWKIMNQPDLATRLRNAALKLVCQRYDWSKSAGQLNLALVRGRK